MTSIEELAHIISEGDVVVVSGAGLSTDSGLPDYRGSGGSSVPSVAYDMFAGSTMWQKWVWQRNQETWRALDRLEPTAGHRFLASWEKKGIVTGTATQNIDALHMKAGSVKVAEMHGSFTRVVCIDCREVTSRADLDRRLRELNPTIVDDGDPANAAILAEADRESAELSDFVVAPCLTCGGTLKPDIVFFGEGVQAMDEAFDYAREARTILVVGSSLLVLTGMWVVSQGLSSGARLAIINRGPTEADRLADIRIDGGISQTLSRVDSLLAG